MTTECNAVSWMRSWNRKRLWGKLRKCESTIDLVNNTELKLVTNYNKWYHILYDTSNRGNWVWEAWKLSVLSFQFFWKSKTVLKKMKAIKKNRVKFKLVRKPENHYYILNVSVPVGNLPAFWVWSHWQLY